MANYQRDGDQAQPRPIAIANAFGLASGLLGVLAGAAGVWLGVSGDAVLGEAKVELGLAASITVIACWSLLVLSTRPALRWVAMGGAALGYHLVLDRQWIPWIERYRSLIAAGGEDRLWADAAALPLLMLAGMFFVAAAFFAWQSNRLISTRRDERGQSV
jgi:hypothetical protein